VPKNVCLSDAFKGVTHRSIFGVSRKEMSFFVFSNNTQHLGDLGRERLVAGCVKASLLTAVQNGGAGRLNLVALCW